MFAAENVKPNKNQGGQGKFRKEHTSLPVMRHSDWTVIAQRGTRETSDHISQTKSTTTAPNNGRRFFWKKKKIDQVRKHIEWISSSASVEEVAQKPPENISRSSDLHIFFGFADLFMKVVPSFAQSFSLHFYENWKIVIKNWYWLSRVEALTSWFLQGVSMQKYITQRETRGHMTSSTEEDSWRHWFVDCSCPTVRLPWGNADALTSMFPPGVQPQQKHDLIIRFIKFKMQGSFLKPSKQARSGREFFFSFLPAWMTILFPD